MTGACSWKRRMYQGVTGNSCNDVPELSGVGKLAGEG